MLNTLAHLGHDHMSEALTLDHCLPVIVGAGIIITGFAGVIIYLLTNWQPKKPAAKAKTKTKRSK